MLWIVSLHVRGLQHPVSYIVKADNMEAGIQIAKDKAIKQ